MINQTIKIMPRTVYGVEKYYPANEHAQQIAKLAGQTTLTKEQLVMLKSMGYTIEIEHPLTALKLDN